MAVQRGTGFTNLNKIMQANRGNRLGQTVSSGITGQVQGVQSNLLNSQNQFQQNANANRLDTPEAEAKRADVLGRFDENNYKSVQELQAEQAANSQQSGTTENANQAGTGRFQPAFDENDFQASSGLSNQYNTNRQTLQQQQTAAQAAAQKNQQQIQDQVKKQQEYNNTMASARNAYTQYINSTRPQQFNPNEMFSGTVFDPYKTVSVGGSNTRSLDPSLPEDVRQKIIAAENAARATGVNPLGSGVISFMGESAQERVNNQSIAALNNLLNSYSTNASAQQTQFNNQLADLDKNYADMTAAEKQRWVQQQREAAVARNLPSEQEMAAFANYRTGTYTGPTGLEDAQTLLGQAQQTEQLGGLARSSGGRQELLRKFVGGDGYTQGQRTLDETLLGQDQTANLGAASRQTRNVTNTVNDANLQAGNLAQEYVNRAQQFGADTRQQIQGVRDPLSQRIDQGVQGLTQQEQTRQAQLTSLQNILSGAGQYSNLDSNARTGLALQAALDSGYLTREQANQLAGTGGLVARANAMGLDTNKLLAERLQGSAALGIDRTAAATADQEARIAALDRLAGRTGTDVEFGNAVDNYRAGNIGFNTDALQDYISKTEAERLRTSPAYRAQLQSMGLDPLEVLSTAGGGALGIPMAQGNILSALAQQTGNSTLSRLAGDYSRLQNQTLGQVNSLTPNVTGGISALASGNLDQAISRLTGLGGALNAASNVANAAGNAIGRVTSGFGAGETGNWATEEFGTVGNNGTVGSFANRSSQEIMDQLNRQIATSNSYGNSGAEGAKAINLLNQYYQQAVARENAALKLSDERLKEAIDFDPKDIENFLNRLKPAAYNYKDKVKNDPRASRNRELGVMAQDLEKSDLGKEAVHDTPEGKVVDYDNLEPKMLASLAALNGRLNKLEGKKRG